MTLVDSFAGFQLDRRRAELRGPGGEVIKLRPKTLAMLALFVANAGRVLSKQELMDGVWPNVHVGDDSLFQCIREIRTALGDDRRQMVKLVSGLGYLFDAEVTVEPPAVRAEAAPIVSAPPPEQTFASEPAAPPRRLGLSGRAAFALAGLAVAVGLAIVTAMTRPALIFGAAPLAVAITPIAGEGAEMAANVTTGLTDGLAKIENIRVIARQTSSAPKADFIVSGELRKADGAWEMRARMTRAATGEVVWTAPVSVATDDADLSLQQSRLVAGVGHPLAVRINELLNSDARKLASDGGSPGGAKAAIEQATESIMQTSPERFAAAQTMLEKALAGDPDNVDVAAALVALQMRGVQMVWYSPADSAAAEARARSILERALRVEPASIPVNEAYCRFLNATNEFVDSLVACSRTLNFDPWDGSALTHMGLAQLELGRFEDAVATFEQADRYDTPPVARWTWKLDLGMTYLVMGRIAEASPWLESSIAITPASGRSYMLLSAAYQGLGRPAEAKAAMEKALALRPGSNLSNVIIPHKNASPAFLAAAEWIAKAFIAAGLPER
jgi:DNA-binding winged helix-turn-helix (wHTH) protein/Tfp pilus assembly protein PilF/TolB-like protein